MLENLPALLSAVVGDTFGACEWQAGNVVGAGLGLVAQRILRRRTEAARDILLDELRRGEKDLSAPEVDEVVAVLLRYGRAAQEGAARLNLRLMAKVIVGQAWLGSLYADEFLRHAEMLASLRREEVIYLGALHRHWSSLENPRADSDEDRMREASRRMTVELVPHPFPNAEELHASAAAIVRTGMLRGTISSGGGTIYKPTRLMVRLCELASFEEAVKAEPA